MLAQVITENGQKKVIPLTADAGAGNPVGTIIAMYKKSSPSGFLYLDGRDTTGTSEELSTHYPLLYAYLGSNVLPDYREFALVGAEENTTSSNIATHDIYTQGEEKDDQLQNHHHKMNIRSQVGDNNNTYNVARGDKSQGVTGNDTGSMSDGRSGRVTRGKRKAVYFYIKATSGLPENQQDNVINTLNEERSYSTTEHATGKKWIDGKPIYRKVVDCGALPNSTLKQVAHNVANIAFITDYYGISTNGTGFMKLPNVSINGLDRNVELSVDKTNVELNTGRDRSTYTATYVTIEYTKTTD